MFNLGMLCFIIGFICFVACYVITAIEIPRNKSNLSNDVLEQLRYALASLALLGWLLGLVAMVLVYVYHM